MNALREAYYDRESERQIIGKWVPIVEAATAKLKKQMIATILLGIVVISFNFFNTVTTIILILEERTDTWCERFDSNRDVRSRESLLIIFPICIIWYCWVPCQKCKEQILKRLGHRIQLSHSEFRPVKERGQPSSNIHTLMRSFSFSRGGHSIARKIAIASSKPAKYKGGGGGGGSSRQEGQSKAAALDRVILYGVPKQEMYHKQMGIYEELEGQRIDDRPCFKHCNNSSSSDFLYFSKEYGGWLVAPSLGNDKCYMFVSSSCRYPSSTTATWALWNGTSWRYDKRITVKDSTVRRPYQTRFHYNWDGGNPASEMPDVIPKPLSETQAKAIEEESSNRVSGASAWNSAGTWEEKSVKIWARARLGQLIEHIGALHVQDDDASFPGNRCRGDGGDGGKIIVFRIIKVNSVSGEADIVFIRNRRRYGVDMEARISIDVQMDAQSFTLNIKVELSNNQAGLPEFSIDWGGGDFWNIKKRERIKNAIKKGVIPPLSDQVATIIEEMKDK
mmetsp:Transcript_20631/g.28692  ORF Transcript_20631/g.28692 Transcript_20631/m.28692 type:complete len:505 (+) Transcript_20631:397-1911(+)